MNVDYYAGADALPFAEECATLHTAAFSASGTRGWTAHEFESLFQRKSTLLFKAKHGFLLADFIGDEGEILSLAVAPDYQGQKIGRALMSKLDETCRYRGVTKCILEVASDNNAAIGLYTRFDFRQFAMRERYFKRGKDTIDALMMSKTYTVP